MSVAEYIKTNPKLKKLIHRMLIPKDEARPRLWVKWFVNPFIHQRGKSVKIRRRVRMDVLPFNHFSIGDHSTIEEFSTINNGVGDVSIGQNTLIGLSNVIIGPVTIGNNVIMAQHVVVSGLNHTYENTTIPIKDQGTYTRPICINDDCWIGANVVITAGVKVGFHSIVAAGSVVTKDVPPLCIVGGNPARILKRYNAETSAWEKEKVSFS
ncbi:acyltransferase [Arundinibacter roseus]|uniref:Acyltransferase n=1 Tax=Arundinibacter roseus TaxID=2070510 RepID=A0A4R4K059_9BACT|nr:acyltransferase [Arundinibacter roseus]TDB59796.1 acyltransferase [Arundinibacter roseus]